MLLDSPTDKFSRAAGRPIVVQKFGGSSLADQQMLGRVADRIVATKRAGCDVVAVVSAMGKSTDALLQQARAVAKAGTVEDALPPRRELDMLVSTGERVSMSLLSIAIQSRGCDAISFTGSQCGIITNDRHFDARIIEVRPHRIEDELARGRIVIVAGYQGMSYRREITTLGRGGTDTTAVALAAALRAERCEIYSDVDGVYSADPRTVRTAAHLPEIDYDTLHEMAHAGAKVLCAQAIDWARRAGIAIFARSTFEPISDAPRQTVVRLFGPAEELRARAVACDRNVLWLIFSRQLDQAALFTLLMERRVNPTDLQLSGSHASLLLSLGNAPDIDGTLAALKDLDPAMQIDRDVARVSVVGSDLTARSDALLQLRSVLSSVGAAPRMIQAAPMRFTVLVAADRAEVAQRALHKEFVE